MMLASDRLRVVPTTIHIPLRDVPASLTEELLETTLRITAKGLKDQFGLTNPRIAVAGLNPHAGEGGAMGQEELEMIVPLLKRLSAEGMNLSGPTPPIPCSMTQRGHATTWPYACIMIRP